MSANNRRIRRVIVELLFDYGPLTKEGMAALLAKVKSVRTVPSPHSLSALMSKNSQIIVTGKEIVENAVGAKATHLVYDINREIIHSKDDITYTRSLTVMSPSEKRQAQKCVCGKTRVFRQDEDVCLHCIRQS